MKKAKYRYYVIIQDLRRELRIVGRCVSDM